MMVQVAIDIPDGEGFTSQPFYSDVTDAGEAIVLPKAVLDCAIIRIKEATNAT